MSASRTLVLSLIALSAAALQAQRLSGRFDSTAVAGLPLRLSIAHGEDHRPVDSVRIAANGSFAFPRTLDIPGYYRLELPGSDGFDLILDAKEPKVDLLFSGLPMGPHVTVLASDENKRLWEYKFASRQAQAVQAAAEQQRTMLQPMDTIAIANLDSIIQRAQRVASGHLDRLLAQAPNSLFAKIALADRGLQGAVQKGPMAVAKVFDFSDPELMRSSVYDKAIMVFLQNLNAVNESQFTVAADTLMHLASGNADCKGYMLEHLIDLFGTYGPEAALQHLVDAYYTPEKGGAHMDPEISAKVEKLMLVSVGRTGSDVSLNDHGEVHRLSELAAKSKYTALFFYSSTCSHCHDQMPTLKRDYELFHDKGFNVLGIALDTDSADFLTSRVENAIPWPCYSHFMGWGEEAAKLYQVKATPTFFLLDAKLRIVAKPNDAEELRNTLRALLK